MEKKENVSTYLLTGRFPLVAGETFPICTVNWSVRAWRANHHDP